MLNPIMQLRQIHKIKRRATAGLRNQSRRMIIVFCILATASALAASEADLSEQDPQVPAYVPGELLVKFRPEVRRQATALYEQWFDISTRRTFAINGYQQVKLPPGVDIEEALELYLDDPDVENAEPNYIVHADIAPPDDPHFSRLWGLNNTGQDVNGISGTNGADIDALEAWDVTTGSSDVVVALVDSGVDINHPDLAANIWTNAAELNGTPGEDDDDNGYVDDINGWDFYAGDSDPRDANGHGTHVAGIIAAVGNNAEGVTGVSWSAKIMPLRFLDAWGNGTIANAIAAIEYANEMGADIINNSWSGGPYSYSQSLKDAIDASDALVVCAAGNGANNNDSAPNYPASYSSPNIISVAASDPFDALAYFSNYGAVSVDVAAPGINIYSTVPGRETIWEDDFDDGNIDGWTTGGTNNTWGATDGQSSSGTYSLTDSPGANYLNNTNSWAFSPPVDLGGKTAAKLEFMLRGTSQAGKDFLWVEASTNSFAWNPVSFQFPDDPNLYNGLSGSGSSWITIIADLEAYDGNNTVYVRFRFTSDGTTTADGWYIDDVKVTTASSTYSGDEYEFKSGTSMATPHVSGLAALIKAHAPAMTSIQIKAAIENNVDFKAALNNKVASDGRINAAAALDIDPPSIVEFPVINSAADTITVTYDEPDMQGAADEANYSFSPSLNFRTLTPTSDDIAFIGGSTYRLSMASVPAYEIMTLTVSDITDLAGNPVTPASITINDNDNDGMADAWETANGLNTSIDDSAGDPDGDGYTNLQEYHARTNPRSAASAPLLIKDTIPENNAGITSSQKVPQDTAFAVLLESAYGINIDNHANVAFTIDDGTRIYSRNLGAASVRVVKLTDDDDSRVTRMWVVYDRSNDFALAQRTYAYDSDVNVRVDATDIMSDSISQASFDFNVETLDEHEAARNPDNLPDIVSVGAEDPDLEGSLDDGIRVDSGDLQGAKIIFDSSELQLPAFGPLNEIPSVNLAGVSGVAVPMNLQPPTVFDTPVKIFIPCPGYTDVGSLNIYYYNGSGWALAADAAGNVQPGADGWMVPGSRVDHNETDPATIEIRVYHFSAAQAGLFSGTSGGGGGGGGCFISSTAYNPVIKHLIFYFVLNLVLVGLGTYGVKKIIRWQQYP
jgi:subtilisin family serine protease